MASAMYSSPRAVNRVSLYFPGVAPANAASGSPRALSPGQYASIYPRGVGFAFGDRTMVFNELPDPLPMPRELADIAVMLDDQPLPLHFVSPGQINFLTPMGNPTSGSGELQVIRPIHRPNYRCQHGELWDRPARHCSPRARAARDRSRRSTRMAPRTMPQIPKAAAGWCSCSEPVRE